MAQNESRISGMINDAQTLVSSVASSAQDAALHVVEQQKAEAAERIEDVARTLDSAAEHVERIVPGTAPYVRNAASTVHDVAEMIRDQSIEDVAETVMDFARRQPLTFFGGSLLAGFALARFLKSSADRRHEEAAAASARQARSSRRSGSRARKTKSAAAAANGDSASDEGAAATADANRSS
jgi:hypothetical protein